MELAPILECYRDHFLSQPSVQKEVTFREQKQALYAMTHCRTEAFGEIHVFCPECRERSRFYHSCGHRSCPKCQHHETSLWLQRQLLKLLPVDYFLVTFTLPAQLRRLARVHPKTVFNLMFQAASETLQMAAANPKYYGGIIGFTGVLHTHSRKLDFHPHIHFVVPGLAYRPKTQVCVHSTDHYLIPKQVLRALFKGKLLSGLKHHGFHFPSALYRMEWVLNCRFAGKGEPALKYLSRYLYRGVIAERNVLTHQDGMVTFRYKDSDNGQWILRTRPGVDFTRLLMQHVLPKGFRRVRDYGFLHGNARKTLVRIQLLLKPKFSRQSPPKRPVFRCSCCGKPTQIIAVGVFPKRNRSPPLFDNPAITLN